ncbi:MAG TPA: CHAD domain-containing protein [Solirubrobacteraceae bacterium]|nr:CHAD domain-containing protein [Solirubrobacteraceae bacterium]
MRARKVTGLDPHGPLADNAERIVRLRLAELYGFVPAALDAGQVETLHDMRIAAKRLRYVLEVTGPCFGSFARTATKRVKDLQDLLGEIHDCDVMLPRVQVTLDEVRSADADHLLAVAGDGGELDPALASDVPHRTSYRGLEVLATWIEARRTLLFDRFLQRWAALERQEFRERLERALDQRA